MTTKRCVKILATLGPATATKEAMTGLVMAGANAFRINMSHTPHDVARAYHDTIREIEVETGHPIAILMDLQGPKLRIATFEKSKTSLKPGQVFCFDNAPEKGNSRRVRLPHPEIFKAIEPGHRLLLDDGRLELRVTGTTPDKITAEVVHGGILSDRKGISLPDTMLPLSAMTAKDRADLDFGLELGIDWVALSFIQRPEDIAEARKLVQGRAAIMAKIEKPSALDYIEEILDLSDGLMVARGDLGVEMPLEQVPGIQKRITRLTRAAGKPVVIATQMLESMISSPVPTRAEVSDVATAVFEGADAIMLSAESAVGAFPRESVATMHRIAVQVENDPTYDGILHAQRTSPEATSADAISSAVYSISDTLNLAAIICYTSSGATALRVARERPRRPVLALSPVMATSRKMSLVWGLYCVQTRNPDDLDDMVNLACRSAFRKKFASSGQRVIITCGVPLGTPGATNMLRIAFVGPGGSSLAR